MWKNIVEPGRPQMAIWPMRITCWIPKATNTHLEYVMLIAFLLQQWLYKCSSVSHVTYIAYPFIFTTVKNTTWPYSFCSVSYSLPLSLFFLLLTKYGPVGPFRGYPELLFPSFPRYSQRGRYPVVVHSVPVSLCSPSGNFVWFPPYLLSIAVSYYL